MTRQFVYVTGNAGKKKRMEILLGDAIETASIDLEEIQSLDPREIAAHKARQAFELLKQPVLVEDTALHIDSLGGLPGSFIKWFLESVGPAGICDMVSGDREARGVNTFAYYDGTKLTYFIGEITGVITKSPRGVYGFGWDAIFIQDGETRTRAEMTEQENAEKSGRGIAMKQFKQFIRG